MIREIRPLTAIRGVAALWVVGHHTQPLWFPDAAPVLRAVFGVGWSAVDVFFVLSGFILADVYAELRPAGAPGFWLRRVCRVYPLPLCVMAVLAGYNLLHHNTASWSGFGASVLMLQPFLLRTLGWNAPTWSVGVELACYAAFPLAILLARRLRRWPAALLLLGLVALEHVVLARYPDVVSGGGALARGVVGFSAGMVLARLPLAMGRVGATALECIGIGIGAWGAIHNEAFLAVAGAGVLIAALACEQGLVAKALSVRPAVWLGAVSFSIYVLHAPLISKVNRLPVLHAPAERLATMLVLLFVLSGLTYRWIEQPGRRLARHLGRLGPVSSLPWRSRRRGTRWSVGD